MEISNGITKEELYKDERIKSVERALTKVRAVMKKYGNPFEGKTTREILKIIRSPRPTV